MLRKRQRRWLQTLHVLCLRHLKLCSREPDTWYVFDKFLVPQALDKFHAKLLMLLYYHVAISDNLLWLFLGSS